MTFQERLNQLRRERGLSQEDLAEVVGVTRQAVQKWESGASRPDMDNLTALADYFGVTLDYLVMGREQPPAAQGQTVINNYYHTDRWEYEYKSERTLWGLPLVHIHLRNNGLVRAKGIIAIGNVATGIVAVGGVLSVGIVSLGVLSAGLLLSVGCLSVGLLAIGCIAAGVVAAGGLAFGWLGLGGIVRCVYGGGGIVEASRVAVGGVVEAPLAIGRVAEGLSFCCRRERSRQRRWQRSGRLFPPPWTGGTAGCWSCWSCWSGSREVPEGYGKIIVEKRVWLWYTIAI